MADALPDRIVSFYGDELVAVQQPDGTIFIVLAPLCDHLGLNQQAQARRIQRHAVLENGLTTLLVQTAGGPQSVQCLKLTLLPLWLSGVQASRVKPELQERLVLYQREAADVLWQAFKPRMLTEAPPGEADQALAITQLEQIIEQSKAMQRLAEEQIVVIRRMDAAARIVKGLQGDVNEVKLRLHVLEDRLHPKRLLTDEQAAEVKNAVNAIAMALTKRDASKNHFQGIHGELHRRFRVTSYALIRQEDYPAVLAFLTTWYAAASSSDAADDQTGSPPP